ncbi:MAG: sugar-binding transcriptional regulator [Actinobacteria bacterium]|nr:sugar-binding transcriptional regulator [Actinomycetota bacterium]
MCNIALTCISEKYCVYRLKETIVAYSTDLIVKVAKLYYEQDCNFNEISEKLKISRYKIYRIIKKAKDTGIVKIIINTPSKSLIDIENKIETLYKLKRVIIVQNQELPSEELKYKIGQAAAGLLLEILEDKDALGVSWGSTVQKILNFLPIRINKKIDVVQLSSGSHLSGLDIMCHELTRQLAERFNSKPYLLFSPEIAKNNELKNLLLEDDSIKKTFAVFDNLTIAIFGVGPLTSEELERLLNYGQITEKEAKALLENKAIAGIFSNYIDNEGRICDEKLTSRAITMPIQKLKDIPYSILLAGGIQKAESILAAIRGGYVNVLVTDEKAIKEVLILDNKSNII